ncbi:hypothetical protein N7450_000050 [Penicillium hetheringtonii]|uniref:Uncharacterized protein n=1 Tax=Penicillium hetheringtonii TaxID=911720 RepID=A0AAD6H0X2_9EURO|nr:hypothetical protein N7450_000050 [Penicillium hetheringtonii]
MAPRRGHDSRPRSAGLNQADGDRVKKSVAARPKRPGRPFKIPRSHSSRSQSSRSSISASPRVATPVRQRSLSILETLPVEVIEKIFLYSLNLHLPRASSVLAVALSREKIYSLLIILALWNDPLETSPLNPAMASMLAPLEYAPLTRGHRESIQAALFRCKWCTMERVREQIPKVMILNLYRLWVDTGVEMDPDQRVVFDQFIKRDDASPLVLQGSGGKLDQILDQAARRFSTSHGPQEYKLRVEPNVKIQILSQTTGATTTWPAIELLEFPIHLLRGRIAGFSSEDVAFLEMLRLCSNNFYEHDGVCKFSTVTAVNRMYLHQGVRNAIRNRNLEALVSLLKIDEFTYRARQAEAGRNTLYTIPSDHFVTITIMCRNNPALSLAFFATLVRASAESIPIDSLEVTEWIVENAHLAELNPTRYKETNGRFAHWLSNFILRLPARLESLPSHPETQLFFCGQLNLSESEACRYFEEVLQPWNEPIMDYMTESSFHPEEFWIKHTKEFS